MEGFQMDERYNSDSIKGYFSYSTENDGSYVNAGSSGKIHLQHRSADGYRLLFVRIREEELDLDFQWHCQGVSCFFSENLIIGERRFVVECSNSNFFGIFNRLIAEIVSDCILSGLKILELFRFEKSFYSAIPNQMTDEQAVGLFGELYLMSHWFSNSMPRIIGNDYWSGPTGASKDYNFSDFQIEVKTSMSDTSPTKHKISSLTQLQLEGVPLILYSLNAIPNPNGGHSLNELVEEIREILFSESHELETSFIDLLESNNFILGHPSNEKYRYSLPMESGTFYSVSKQFPRLVSADDVDDERIHIEDYSITLVGVEDLKLMLSPPLNPSSLLNEYFRINNSDDQGSN